MPKAPNAPNAFQQTSRARTWQAARENEVSCKQMVVADTLSRRPPQLKEKPDTVEDVQAFIDLVESTMPATDNQLERVKEASAKDAQLQKVIEFTSQGWPSPVEEVPPQIREFFDARVNV